MPHTYGEITVRRLDKKVVMVAHEAICVADPVITVIDTLKSGKKSLAIGNVSKDVPLFITPRGYMVDGAGIFYPERACHNKGWLS